MSNTSRTDWDRIDEMDDEEIDYSDIPSLTEEFFAKATLRLPVAQASNLVKLDRDIDEDGIWEFVQ